MHPQILFAHSCKVDHQKPCSAPPIFTKLHPSYHLNSTQPDHAMWQSPPLKISQPEQATCHNPLLTKLTTQILPRHHLLHLTHETLTLIFFSPSTTMAAAAAPPHLAVAPLPATTNSNAIFFSRPAAPRATTIFLHSRRHLHQPPSPPRTIMATPFSSSSSEHHHAGNKTQLLQHRAVSNFTTHHHLAFRHHRRTLHSRERELPPHLHHTWKRRSHGSIHLHEPG